MFGNLFHRGRRTSQVSIPPVKPRVKNEYGYYKMTCPFCLKEFDVWEMPFRASVQNRSTANTGSDNKAPAPEHNVDITRSRSMDRNTLGQSAPLVPQSENTEEIDVHFFRPEVDEVHEEFLREMRIDEAHNVYKGKVLTVFKPGRNGAFDCSGIEAVRLFGSDRWIAATEANAEEFRHQAVAKIRDQFGNTSEERLCPHCHNPMPEKAGQLPNYVIMILGDTYSGKTVYKIRMLYEMNINGMLERRIGVNDFFCRSATDGVAAPSISQLYADTFEKAYSGESQQIADSTKVMYIDPYTLTLRCDGKETALITLYDFPGEAIRFSKDVSSQEKYVKSIRNRMEVVDGIMFLLDLTTVDFMANNLEKEYITTPPNKKNFVPWSPKRVLDGFMNNYLPSGRDNVPICYMFSKADLLEMAIKDCREGKTPWSMVGNIKGSLPFLNNPPACVTNRRDLYLSCIEPSIGSYQEMEQKMELFDKQHEQVDMENILQSDMELQRLLGSSLGILRDRFRKGLLFAVSAVGAPIRSDDKHVEQCEALRVMEPMEYLLWQMGLVESKLPSSDTDKARLAQLRQ